MSLYDESIGLAELHVLSHATGWAKRGNRLYRNFFCADTGHADMPHIESLCARGYMEKVRDETYRVTAGGIDALRRWRP